MTSKILLVEDNATNRYLATFLLRNAGYTVIHAENGEEAIRMSQSETPDLVLMDIQMPEMDGYEAARRIKETAGGENLAIVAVTSHALSGDREKAMDRGFSGYIEKPIVTETFIAQIENFISGKRASNENPER